MGLEMTRLPAKPNWWTKFSDEKTLAKWRAEALEQTEELGGYAKLRDENTGAEVRVVSVLLLLRIELKWRAGLVLRPYLAI